MNDIVVGLVAILTGAVFCFRGYLAMRIIIPLWGAFAGFMLGAGIVATDAGFLATALGWIVGFAVAEDLDLSVGDLDTGHEGELSIRHGPQPTWAVRSLASGRLPCRDRPG